MPIARRLTTISGVILVDDTHDTYGTVIHCSWWKSKDQECFLPVSEQLQRNVIPNSSFIFHHKSMDSLTWKQKGESTEAHKLDLRN